MTHHHYTKEKSPSQAMDVTLMAKSLKTGREFATAAKLGSPLSGMPNQRLATWGSAPSAKIVRTKKLAFDMQRKTSSLDAKERKAFTTKNGESGFAQRAS
jgi:hypothetical protein